MAAGRAAAAAGLALPDTVDTVIHAALSHGEGSVAHGCVSEALRLRAQGKLRLLDMEPLDSRTHDLGLHDS